MVCPLEFSSQCTGGRIGGSGGVEVFIFQLDMRGLRVSWGCVGVGVQIGEGMAGERVVRWGFGAGLIFH